MSVDPARIEALLQHGLQQGRGRPGAGLSRRSFVRGTSLSAMALGLPGLLAACGTDAQTQTTAGCQSTDASTSEAVLNWANWPEYIDVKGKRMPTLEEFQSSSGVKVTYNAEVNDNNEFFGKVKDQLGACEPTGRDIVTLTDWMAARMISFGWIQELDKANLPNVEANLAQSLRSPSWDPDRSHSVPWQSGLTGIAYNSKYTGEISSFEELMTRKDLKGKISLLTELPDTMGFMLLLDGSDPEDFAAEQWDSAIDRLQGYVESGHIRKFTGNNYIRDLNAGNLVACEAWSGDVIATQFDNPDIKWVVPEEGLAIWSDNMMVPNKSTHKANAEKLMNYYYEPEVAATVSAWVNYICPVEGARDAMEKVDPSLVDNPLIFPDEAFLSGAFTFMGLDDKVRQGYDKDFARVIGA